MKLKYVGAKPKVSQYGIQFDQTKPDKYTFIHAAIELLETLNTEMKSGKNLYLHNIDTREYTSDVLNDKIGKYCPDMEQESDQLQEKTNELINEYKQKVKENVHLNNDERTAWLGNIDIMRDYYLQYITNEFAYNCLLNTFADKLHSMYILEMTFPLGRNYGLVCGDLIVILRDHKPPYDAILDVIERDDATVGRLNMNRK